MPFEASPIPCESAFIDGEAVVTIRHEEYMALRGCRLAIERWKARGLVNEDNSFGLFSHDAEVAVYLAARFGLMTAREAIQDIERRFGEDRKPTVSEVKRFWVRFQKCLIPKGEK